LQPDLLLTNGNIYLGSGLSETARSVAVRDGRILAIGDVQTSQKTEVIDLRGHTVLPGFIDSHTHFCKYGLNLSRINLEGVSSVERAAQMVGQAALKATPGAWILGYNWDQHRLGRWPSRQDLDPVTPHNPVALTRRDVHALWVNSEALRIAGITVATPDPSGGRIERDAVTGEPNGILRETALPMVLGAIPKPGRDGLIEAVARASEKFHSFGVTSVHTMEGLDEFRTLAYLRQRGELGLRFHTLIAKADLDHFIQVGLRTGFGDEWIRIGAVKMFLDGTLGSQTAEMIEPFEGSPNRGIVYSSDDEVGPLVKKSVEAGISVAMHAIGDGAVRRAIGHFERAPISDLRHRIEHVQLVHPDDLERLRNLHLIGSVQPMFVISDFDVAYKYWGGRTRYGYAFRSLRDHGMNLAFGSDCPVEIPNVIDAIDAACNRRSADGRTFYEQEKLAVRDAIQAFTIGGAFASGEENLKGSIEPGKLADFTVLSDDPFRTSNIRGMDVVLTVVGGKTVYSKL
jgi:predicted amidohydrolase YtcJ